MFVGLALLLALVPHPRLLGSASAVLRLQDGAIGPLAPHSRLSGSAGTVLRLQGGAVGAEPTTFSLALKDKSLHVIDDMYPSRLGDRPPILEGLSEEFVNASSPPTFTATGAVFLHTAHQAAAHEHLSSLGMLRCHRLIACARVTRYWMGPAFGTKAHHVPHDTQFLLLELEPDGPYALVLPLVDSKIRASLRGKAPPWHRGRSARHDELLLHAESGDPEVTSSGMRALYVAAGADPYALLRRGFAEVAEEVGTFTTLDKKQLPPSVDQFGWCTWDAFYSKVTPDGVLSGVEALRAAGVPPRTLILDDGWQQVDPPPAGDAAGDAAGVEDGRGDSERAVVTAGARVTAVLGAVSAWIASRLVGGISAIFEAFYESFVRRAAHGSLSVSIWRALVKSVLRGSMQSYFEEQTDFARQLDGFAPNAKFEAAGGEGGRIRSLGELVNRCKRDLGVRHVYCWHALAGYWRGASASLGERSNLAIVQAQPTPSRHLLTIEPQLGWDAVTLFGVGLLTESKQLASFYKKLHEPLAAAGVDGVKVDVQSGVPALGGGVGGGPNLARAYTKAMEASVVEHFSEGRGEGSGGEGGGEGGVNCINCMCHSTENLYQYSSTAVARASDDFYPRRPDSHTVHLVNVAYNSLFLGEICLPDWDMFHSQHEVGALHAAARAVGGCPVYVSDAPGNHDVPLLRRLVLPDGSILRGKLPGRPTRDCLFADVGRDGVSALKVWNANTVGGVVGAFHVQGVAWSWQTRENVRVLPDPPPITARVRPRDIETLRAVSGPFASWRHRGARVEVLPTADSAVEVELRTREWELFTVVPIQQLAFAHAPKSAPAEDAEEAEAEAVDEEAEAEDVGDQVNDLSPPERAQESVAWAPFGLGEMLNSGGAIIEAGELLDAPGGGVHVALSCRAAGRLYAYCRPAPSRILHQSEGSQETLPFGYDGESGKLDVALPELLSTVHLTIYWD